MAIQVKASIYLFHDAAKSRGKVERADHERERERDGEARRPENDSAVKGVGDTVWRGLGGINARWL